VILVAISTVGPLGLNIFVPSMPGLQHTFQASSGMVQATLTVYIAAIALCQLFYGPLSDRYGRRPVLLAGLALYVAASLACALAPTIEVLIVARGVQAIGGASGMILSRAIVRDLHERDKAASVLGYITMAWVLAPMVAPLVGGLLDEAFSFRASFALLAVIGAAVWIATWRSLRETNRHCDPGTPLIRPSVYAGLARNPAFLSYAATIAFASAVFFCYLAMAPFVIIAVRGYSPITYGLWSFAPALGYMCGNFLSGRYSQAQGVDRMIGYGNAVTLAGAGVMLGFAVGGFVHPASLFLPMALCTLGNGLTIANGISAAISTDPKAIGSAAGIAGAFQMALAAVIAQLVGQLQSGWAEIGFSVIAASGLCAMIAFQVGRRLSAARRQAA